MAIQKIYPVINAVKKNPLTDVARRNPIKRVIEAKHYAQDSVLAFKTNNGSCGIGVKFYELGGWGGMNGIIKNKGHEMPFHATLTPGATPQDIISMIEYKGKLVDITELVKAGKRY